MTRFPFAAVAATLAVFVACASGVAAFWDLPRQVFPAPLSAEVRLDPVVLPAGIDVDATAVAEYLTTQLTRQAERDVAIRMTLGKENVAKMIETVFPRVVNPSLITRMFDRIPPLKAVLSLGGFRAAARVGVVNAGTEPLADVAMTLPGVVLAERPDGTALEIHASAAGPSAIRIGMLEPGARLEFVAWTTAAADSPGIVENVRLGAADGVAGDVALHAGEGWLGENLAAQPWSRWLVGTVLVSATLAALGMLGAILVGARGDSRKAAASRA